MRRGRPSRSTNARTPSPSAGKRVPTGKRADIPSPQAATVLAVPSPSSRSSAHSTSPSRFAASSATLARTCAGDASFATSVATRRSAACSSPSRSARPRDSALAIAVPTKSVNCAIRDSVSDGRGRLALEWTARAPHNRPSTTIGQPTDELTPSTLRIVSAIGPGTLAQSSTRAAARLSRIIDAGSPGSIGQRSGTGGCSPAAAQVATVVTDASSS
jgi:hypothetical protein